jgi:hypothetical protein
MAFSITGDKAIPVVQGDFYVVTATDLTITDGDQYSRFHMSTAPTVGTMYRDGVALALLDEFNVADIAAGLIIYSNDGVAATNDAPEFIATPYTSAGVAGTPTAAAAVTITVTAGLAWILMATPFGEAPQLIGYNVERYVMDLQAIAWAKLSGGSWVTALVGASDTIDVTNYVTASSLAFVNDLTNTVQDPIKDYSAVERMRDDIVQMVTPAAWNDLETAVKASGALIYTSATVYFALSEAVRTQAEQMRSELQLTPSHDDFLYAMDLAKAALP